MTNTTDTDTDTDTDTEYDHLDVILAAYAESDPRSPERGRLQEQLVSGYLPIAHHIAQRYANRGEPLDDLKQVACLGLVNALNRYQPELSRNFLAYVIPTITGEIRRHFRDRTWSMRVPRRLKELTLDVNRAVADMTQRLGRAPKPSEIAALLRLSLDDVLQALEAAHAYRAESLEQPVKPDNDGLTLSERIGESDNRYELFTDCHSLAPHLTELPDRERQILVMRFYDDMSQSQIAERFGISQMHVSRLLTRTLEHLRAVLTTDDTSNSATATVSTERILAAAPPTPRTSRTRRQAA
jgi:RNA polymerase sigma-B factor